MDRAENGFGRKRQTDTSKDANDKKQWKQEINFEDDIEDIEDSNEIPRTPRKNPTISAGSMSVRAAKRIWFSPRKSGRPSKDISDKLEEAKKVLETAGEPLKRTLVRKSKEDQPKRPRGRPKKPITTTVKEKRPRGRPRKNPISMDKPKRPRGRPRKHLENSQDNKPQRPRGRPRKNPIASEEDLRNKKKT